MLETLLVVLIVGLVGLGLKLQSVETEIRLLRAEGLKGHGLTLDEEADVATGVKEPAQLQPPAKNA